jgi:acetylornithine deacetylase
VDAVDYARDLVRFDSVSRVSNAEVSNFVEEALRRQGFDIERLEYDDNHGVRKVNILGKKGEGSGGLGYFAHTDVVPATTWRFTDHGPFDPFLRDGRLYGRGSCDMKGSLACMLAAAENWSRESLRSPVYITCTADEEIGYGGAEKVAQSSALFQEMVAGDTRGIIGEPTRLEVVHAHKGTYGFTVVSRGRAAHSSTNEGLNANLAMIPFLQDMKRMHDELENDPEWHHPAFSPRTLSWNIGINDHTAAVNITAPQSVCTVYFRPMPGQNADELIERARRSAQRHGLEFKVNWRGQPLWIEPDAPLVREALRLAGKPAARTVAYGTDGAMFTALKNMIVLGPGDIAQAHTDDEWIDLNQVKLGVALYSRMIEAWCT